MMDQQLVVYIQQQLRNGYDMNAVRSFLAQQGYNPNDVNEAADFVNTQRLSSLVDYVRSSLGKGIDPDSIRSQLQASGYPMPDINDALARAQKKTAKSPTSLILIVLVALVIFGLGLFFFWPSGKAEGTARPDIIGGSGTETGKETPGAETAPSGIEFETEPTISPEEEETLADISTGYEPEQDDIDQEFQEAETQPAAEEDTAGTEFSAETSDFEEIIDRASKEGNVDNALKICEEAENDMYKDACYSQLSKTFDSPAICAKITEESLKDECYLRAVLKSKDSALCENIIDSSLYNSCISVTEAAPAQNATLEDYTDWSV